MFAFRLKVLLSHVSFSFLLENILSYFGINHIFSSFGKYSFQFWNQSYFLFFWKIFFPILESIIFSFILENILSYFRIKNIFFWKIDFWFQNTRKPSGKRTKKFLFNFTWWCSQFYFSTMFSPSLNALFTLCLYWLRIFPRKQTIHKISRVLICNSLPLFVLFSSLFSFRENKRFTRSRVFSFVMHGQSALNNTARPVWEMWQPSDLYLSTRLASLGIIGT